MSKLFGLPDLRGYINTAELLKSLGLAGTAGLVAFLATFSGHLGDIIVNPSLAGLALTLVGFVLDLLRKMPQGKTPPVS